MSNRRRTVVTGVRLVSPVGIGTAPTWQAMLNGRSGIAPITLFYAERFAVRFAREVKDFDPEQSVDRKDVKKNGPLHPICARGDRLRIGSYGVNPVRPRLAGQGFQKFALTPDHSGVV